MCSDLARRTEYSKQERKRGTRNRKARKKTSLESVPDGAYKLDPCSDAATSFNSTVRAVQTRILTRIHPLIHPRAQALTRIPAHPAVIPVLRVRGTTNAGDRVEDPLRAVAVARGQMVVRTCHGACRV